MDNRHEKIKSSQVSLTGSSQVHLTGHAPQGFPLYQSSQVLLTGFAEKQSGQLDTINTLTMVYSETERLRESTLREPFVQSQNKENHSNTKRKELPPTMPRRRLKTVSDLRRYLANLINRVEQGEATPEMASKLGYLSNILLRVIEGSDFEKRINELELNSEANNHDKR